MPANIPDPNILRATGEIGTPGLRGTAEYSSQDLKRLKDSLTGIGKAVEAGLDPRQWMQDLALLRDRNAEAFKRETEAYKGAAKNFINKLSGLSLSMADSARMCEKAQAELRAKAMDYTRAFKGMGVAGDEAAKQGKAALLTGFGDSISAFVKQIRTIKVLDLSPEQRRMAVDYARVDRDKALAGNQRQVEMGMAGDEKSRRATASAIGTAMKDAAKAASGVGSGGIVDMMAKGGSLNKAIATAIQSGSGVVGKTLGAMAANEKSRDPNYVFGMMSKTLGSMPQMFQQLIGYAGQFTAIAMSWSVIVRILTEVASGIDFYRKMQGTAVAYSVTNNKGLIASYGDVASAVAAATGDTRKAMWTLGSVGREIQGEAFTALTKSGLAGSGGYAKGVGDLTNAWMRAVIVGAEFGRSVSESLVLAEKVTKAFGKSNVPENMRTMLAAARAANLSFEDMNSLLGDATDLSVKFGATNAKSLQIGTMLSLKDNDSWAEKSAILKAYNSLLNAPLTYKAGLVMGASMSNPNAALGRLFSPGKGETMQSVMSGAIGGYMGVIDKNIKQWGMEGQPLGRLAKGAAYGALYQNPAIAETYAFLDANGRKRFDNALARNNKTEIESFIRQAGAETAEQKGLVAMNKQVSIMEKVLVAITGGFQTLIDVMPHRRGAENITGDDFINNVNSAEFRVY